jgi:hypothetical protein
VSSPDLPHHKLDGVGPFSNKDTLPMDSSAAHRSHTVALWIGLLYLWALAISGFFLRDFKHGDAIVSCVLIGLVILMPLCLTTIYAAFFPTARRDKFLITGIPAVLAILLQYFLLSFIPFLIVPKGVLNHTIGPPHPFDMIGQFFTVLPILAWAVLYPIAGGWIASFFRWTHRKIHTYGKM